MKIIVLVLMFLIINVSLEAYEKQIVLDKFKDSVSAESALKKFKNDRLYAQFDSLASGNDLKILVCSHDDYNTLIVEPIGNKYILEAVMDIVTLKFKESYSEDLTPCKEIFKSVETASKSVKMPPKSVTATSKSVDNTENIYSEEDYPAKIIFSNFSIKDNADIELKKLQHQKIYKELDALAVKNSFIIHARPLGKYTVLTAEPIADPKVYNEVMTLLKTVYQDAYGIGESKSQKQISKKSVGEEVSTPKQIPELKKEMEEVAQNTKTEAQKEDAERVAPIVEKVKEEIENPTQDMEEEEPEQDMVAEETKQDVAVEETKQDVEKVKPAETAGKTDVVKTQVEQESESESGYFSWWYVSLIIVSIIFFLLYKKFKPIYDQY